MPRDRNYRIGKLKGDKSPYWYIFYSQNGRSKRCSTGETSRAEAEAFLAGFILERDAPEKKPRESMTLQMVFDDYFLEHGPRLANRKRAEMSRDRVMDYFGNVVVAQITRSAMRAYGDWRRTTGKVKDSTINRETVVLRAAMNHAVKEERLESAPFIQKLQEPPARDRYLTPDEAGKLYGVFVGRRPRLFMNIALRTGARPGAIRDLTWEQVDFHGRIIRFHPDGMTRSAKRRATVPMSDQLYDILQREREHPQCHPAYVLSTRRGKLSGDMTMVFKKASASAKIKHCSPNMLRHTVATWLAQNGVEVWKISLLLGHSFGGTTSRYMHHSPDHLRDVVNMLDTCCAQLAHYDTKTLGNYNKK